MIKENNKINAWHRLIKVIVTLLLLTTSYTTFGAMPEPWQINLQPPASVVMEAFTVLYDFLFWISVGIVLFVCALLVYVCVRFNAKANPVPATFSHNILVEVIWTVIPIIILIIIAIPSFHALRLADKAPPADVIIKVVGYQWYWNYTYPDHNITFDSYLINDPDPKQGQIRLLSVDNHIVIPENTVVKFVVTAADVIHSFALPAFGLKIDAIPGRINETWTKALKKGVYYGQCSELCGVNHGFMPIMIEVVSKEDFANWLVAAKSKFANNSNKIALHH